MPKQPNQYDELAAKLDELGASLLITYTHTKNEKGYKAVITAGKKTACACTMSLEEAVSAAVALFISVHGKPSQAPVFTPYTLGQGWG